MEGRMLVERYVPRGVEVTLVVDAALAGLVREGDVVLVGADGVQADGRLVNKTGTLGLALAARRAGVPLYAACETFKLSHRRRIPLEEKDPREVWPARARVVNIYFERVPPDLVTGFVTERGVVRHGGAGWPVEPSPG
jgi:methylthioribose-1-phosphate isomerase